MKEKELRFELGKIQRADIGFGGYDDAMFGISFTLEGKAWGVSDFWGTWGFQPSETAKWKEYRIRTYGETMNKILALCEKAKVTNAKDLVGIPVKVYFKDFNTLSHWEILKEVL